MRDDLTKVDDYFERTLPQLSERLYRRALRVPRSIFQYLCDHMSDGLVQFHEGGRQQVEPDKKIALFLKYIGSHDTELEISQLFRVQESTFVKCRRQVCKSLLDNIMPLTITWPGIADLPQISLNFNTAGQYAMPGVIGAIDGSHIAIAKPLKYFHPDAYYNRKSYHSILLQGVARDDCRFIDVSVGVPGRVHDAAVLKQSAMWATGQQKCGNYRLLGDAAYPLVNWLMTPYRDNGHLTAQQQIYNKVQSSKRQVIERAFGLLKRRFRRLKFGFNILDLDEISDLILASCCLHNLCILWDTDEDFGDDDDIHVAPNYEQPLQANNANPVVNDNGHEKRNQLTTLVANTN